MQKTFTPYMIPKLNDLSVTKTRDKLVANSILKLYASKQWALITMLDHISGR